MTAAVTEQRPALEEYAELCREAEARGHVPEQIRNEQREAQRALDEAHAGLAEYHATIEPGAKPDAARVRKLEQAIRTPRRSSRRAGTTG
jgi:hypothetical protein